MDIAVVDHAHRRYGGMAQDRIGTTSGEESHGHKRRPMESITAVDDNILRIVIVVFVVIRQSPRHLREHGGE